MINIISYQPAWQQAYLNEARRITQTLSEKILKIHHIGSTAIINMPAKPIIDLLATITSYNHIEEINKQLNSIGYRPVSRSILHHNSFITNTKNTSGEYNLHLFEEDDPQVERHLLFRDYMNEHPDEVLAYSMLKQELAKSYSSDIIKYTIGKTKFVQQIDSKAWKPHSPKATYYIVNFEEVHSVRTAQEINLYLLLTYFAQYSNDHLLIRIPGCTRILSKNKNSETNMVLDTDFKPDDITTRISMVIDWYKKENTSFSWWAAPSDKPTDLKNHLNQLNYHQKKVITMTSQPINYPVAIENPILKIEWETDIPSLKWFCEIWKNYSSLHNFLIHNKYIKFAAALLDGKPIISCIVVLYGSIAGLYFENINDSIFPFLKEFYARLSNEVYEKGFRYTSIYTGIADKIHFDNNDCKDNIDIVVYNI